jgi:hypothetical protein
MLKKPTVVAAAVGFSILGVLSAPRFRSVLSHWIYRCELGGLCAEPKGVSSFHLTPPDLFTSPSHYISPAIAWRTVASGGRQPTPPTGGS